MLGWYHRHIRECKSCHYHCDRWTTNGHMHYVRSPMYQQILWSVGTMHEGLVKGHIMTSLVDRHNQDGEGHENQEVDAYK